MVALAAFERAVSHHVRCGAIGSRTGRFGIRGIHLAPPHSLSMPHILAESLPNFAQSHCTSTATLGRKQLDVAVSLLSTNAHCRLRHGKLSNGLASSRI